MAKRCRDCNVELVIEGHKQIKPKQLRGEYYYSKWWKCRQCGKIFFDNQWKVYNNLEDQEVSAEQEEAIINHQKDMERLNNLIYERRNCNFS